MIQDKPKGVAHLIEIENPNRMKPKAKKITDLDVDFAATGGGGGGAAPREEAVGGAAPAPPGGESASNLSRRQRYGAEFGSPSIVNI